MGTLSIPSFWHVNETEKEYIDLIRCVPPLRPKEAVIAVTYRCNARCDMCNIWKTTEHDEMEPVHYKKLPESLVIINITGGEPFLRKDLVEVVKNIHARAPRARIVFSTNGYRTDAILSALTEIRSFHGRIGVGVSIDGTKNTHNKIRGVQGIYDKALSTIEQLKNSGIRDLRIGMTLLPENIDEIQYVHGLSKQLGVEFTTTFAHNSEIYFKKRDNNPVGQLSAENEPLSAVIRAQLRSSRPKDWLRAYHMQGISDAKLRSQFLSHCEAGRRYFFMSPSGDVFPCMVMNQPIGNLRLVGSWDDMFPATIESKVRASVKACSEDCWMVCNTRSLIIAHPVKAGSWVVRSKLRAHMSGGSKAI